jgi:hypothetical protein
MKFAETSEQPYCYKDLTSFVHDVNNLIQAGKGIDSEWAKKAADGASPDPDFLTCLSHYEILDDKELKTLLSCFFLNTFNYGSCYYVDISPTSFELIPIWRKGTKDKILRCQNLSDELTDKILGKIRRVQNKESPNGKTI